MTKGKIAVVRVRGRRNMKPKIKKTLELLKLERTNHCVVINNTPQNAGMLKVVKDYVAFGSIDEETLFKLVLKRGIHNGTFIKNEKKEDEIKKLTNELFSGKKVSELINAVFRLHPPRKGYKDTKTAYPLGDLGHRNDMNSLIRRMM